MNNKIKQEISDKYNLSQSEIDEMENDTDSLMEDAIRTDKGGGCAIYAPQRIGNHHFKVYIAVDKINDYFELNIQKLTIDEYLDFLNELKERDDLIEIKSNL